MPKILIDQLWAGESGAATFRRKQGQVSRGRNVRFDVALGGAAKRCSTILINDLDGNSTLGQFHPQRDYHWFAIRDAVIAIDNGAMTAWDGDGIALIINDTTEGDFFDYIAGSQSDKRIRTAVSFDTGIVLNRTVKTKLFDTWSHQQSLNFLVNGDFRVATGVPIIGAAAAFVDDFSHLPPDPDATPPTTDPSNGAVRRTRFDYQFDPAGTYIYWDGSVAGKAIDQFDQHNNWWRIPAHRQGNGRWDETTMPYRLTYNQAAATITISACPWKQRLSGNQATNGRMPFANRAIADVQFHHGRLFLIPDANVCSSRKDDVFNLWVNNVNAVADDDRIALDVTESGIGQMLHARVAGKSMLLIAENRQIEFHSADQPLTNANGQQKVISDFQAADVQPATAANACVMLDALGDIHRFDYTNNELGIVYTEMLNIHRRKLLFGKDVGSLHLVNDTLFICCEEDDMLVHDSFSVQGNLVQSAWGQFTMQDYPVFVNAWAGEIRIVTRDAGSRTGCSMLSYLHREQEPPQGMLYMPQMDRLELIAPADMTYNADDRTTTLRHAGRRGSFDRSFVMRRDEGLSGYFQKCKTLDNYGDPVFAGDLTGTAQYLGFDFSYELTLTKLWTMTAMGVAVERLAIFFYESVDFAVDAVNGRGESILSRPVKWQSPRVDLALIGQPSLDTNFKEITSVAGDPRDMEITISSASPGPCSILGLEYWYAETGLGHSG